jgi:hypothetical protein
MTPIRYIGDAPLEPGSAAWLRFEGNCTAAVSVTALDAVRIGLELQMTPRLPPHEGSLTVNCLWARRGTALFDRQCVDLTRSSTPPPERPGALIRALLDALGRGDTDINCDASRGRRRTIICRFAQPAWACHGHCHRHGHSTATALCARATEFSTFR